MTPGTPLIPFTRYTLCLVLFAGACGPGRPAAPTFSVMNLLGVVDRAAGAGAAGADIVADADPGPVGIGFGHVSEGMQSVGFRGADDGTGFCAHSVIRRFLWRDAVAAAPLGAPEVALAHAAAQARVLAAAGFVPIDAAATVMSSKGGPQVDWSVRGPSGASGSRVEIRPDVLVHRRIYHAQGTPAFVLVRTEYESRTGLATTELTVVSSTPDVSAGSPDLAVPVVETITAH